MHSITLIEKRPVRLELVNKSKILSYDCIGVNISHGKSYF